MILESQIVPGSAFADEYQFSSDDPKVREN